MSWVGSPHACTTSPSGLNSITVGAGTQHVPIGGSWTTAVSSGVNVSSRCVTQTWSWESTKTAVTAPMIHLLGISRGHVGSTRNVGVPPGAATSVASPAVAGSGPASHATRKVGTITNKVKAKILRDPCILLTLLRLVRGPHRHAAHRIRIRSWGGAVKQCACQAVFDMPPRLLLNLIG